MKAVAIIPARLGSRRLARKALREIAGQPMVAWVYRAARASSLLDDVIVATDAEEILDFCSRQGFHARMTRKDHRSGTDRVREVACS
ncbi:MAG TPA: NTP transferase domain-containing protein, partial [Terriglobales bacterium]|nr:NTP transferase domain-containing protein [Terriglobales bacterium]